MNIQKGTFVIYFEVKRWNFWKSTEFYIEIDRRKARYIGSYRLSYVACVGNIGNYIILLKAFYIVEQRHIIFERVMI